MRGEAARGLAQTAPLRLVRALAPTLLPSDRARSVRESAERWLEAHGERPFFLWLHFLDPHAPYGDRDGASTSLVLDLVTFEGSGGPDVPFRGVGRVRAGEYRPDAEERARIEGLYRQDVAFADGEIERLLDLLDSRHLAAHTAIVFTADHGEEFWDHGSIEHGRTLYEEVLHVPLVIVPPRGAVVPAVRPDLTAVEDVAVSALGLVGVLRMDLPGTNLFAEAPPSERALALGNLLFGEEWTGMRTPLLKYMRSASGEERLYDLASDPDERVNVVASQQAAVAELRERLAAGGALERAPRARRGRLSACAARVPPGSSVSESSNARTKRAPWG
jgi:arylsulfatase